MKYLELWIWYIVLVYFLIVRFRYRYLLSVSEYFCVVMTHTFVMGLCYMSLGICRKAWGSLYLLS